MWLRKPVTGYCQEQEWQRSEKIPLCAVAAVVCHNQCEQGQWAKRVWSSSPQNLTLSLKTFTSQLCVPEHDEGHWAKLSVSPAIAELRQ